MMSLQTNTSDIRAIPSALAGLKPHYRSGTDHLGRDFFEPCLASCDLYQRASGFFSSKSLLTWARALPRLIRCNETMIELLISPYLSDADRDALRRVTSPEEKADLQRRLTDEMVEEAIDLLRNPSDDKKRLDVFAWLVANGRLEIRFAFPRHIEGAQLFHEKLGVFSFPHGGQVAFTGSANETKQGHSTHYESVDVYRSWIPGDADRVRVKQQQFHEAWERRAIGLEVVDLSDEILARIRELAPPFPPQSLPSDPPQPEILDPWRHQAEAVAEFLRVRTGVLEMATGTGKTRTALRITEELLARRSIEGVVISTAGTDLLDQWYREVQQLVLARGLTVYRHFGIHHQLGLFAGHASGSILIASRESLRSLFSVLPPHERTRLFIVHDEVHGLGSLGSQRHLRGEHCHFPFRLGLSATPEREYDPEGTDFIREEIGDVFYRFELEDAIRRGILCEFDYRPLDYELTEGDRQRLRGVHRLKALREKEGNPMPDEEFWRRLAAVSKTAEEKPEVFSRFLADRPNVLENAIVFVHTREYGNSLLDLVHRYPSRYSTYYADDDRSRLLAFAKGELDCLITCHRISQGIDIHRLESIVLFAADRARLETIQRIGRCLRTDPENPSKRALVVDFVRDAGEAGGPTRDTERAAWLSSLAKVRREEFPSS